MSSISQSSCSWTQAKRMSALHDARTLVPEKVPGPHDGEENTSLAVCSSFAHVGPIKDVLLLTVLTVSIVNCMLVAKPEVGLGSL
jgi:hypothetical protein